MLTRNPNLSPSPQTQILPHEIKIQFGTRWWTGLAPETCPGFDQQKKELHALPLINYKIASRQDILDYFNNTWTLTELLFLSLKNESAFASPPYHGLRHPLIFYYGHPAVLFINKLRVAGLLKDPVDLYLEKVLETGVDEMSWDDLSKNEMTWPSVETVHAYRKKIYQLIQQLISTHPDLDDLKNRKMGPDSAFWALLMGFEHEKIHFETSSVLIRELPVEKLETPMYWPKLNPTRKNQSETLELVRKSGWQKINSQVVTWGKSIDASSYGWDNEYGTRTKSLNDFEVTPLLITNAEFYEFVKSGSYIKDQYWSEEGLRWRKFRNTKRPTFWLAYGPEGLHEYRLRTLFEVIPMPWDWPVEVNFHEAQAYCHWKKEMDKSSLIYRLITEPEHVAIRDHTQNQDPVLNLHYLEKYNFNFSSGSASPVDMMPANSKKIHDVFGNVWQWAMDQFNPLDGFQVHPFYDDFSTPCFDGKHQMILGGSFISCGHEASQFARFHFRPHFFQHSGFRMARTLDGSDDNGSTRLVTEQTYVHPTRKSSLDQMQNQDWWKNVQQPLELTADELNSYWKQTISVAQALEVQIAQSSAMGSALNGETHDLKSDFQVPYQTTRDFPARSSDFDKNIKLITEELAPLGQRPGHPGYMAYVAGAGNPISVMAQTLSMTLNPYSSHFNMAPGLVSLEAETLKWFLNMAGLPEKTAGGLFTTGGSLANLQALAVARNQKFKSTQLDKARFYASDQVHHCIGKALSFLGFPQSSLSLIEVDSEFRMKPDVLKKQIQKDLEQSLVPVAIIATAGTTNTGAIDPLEEISKIASDMNVWWHVDGAYGAPFMLTISGKEKLKAISLADSIALDPHKAMSLPYGTGLLMVKNRNYLSTDYPGSSTYMPPSSGLSDPQLRLDFADIGPELSRDYRGLRVWLPIKTLGIEPFQLNLEEKLKLSDYVFQELEKIPELMVVSKPQLTIQTFRHKDPSKTRKLMGLVNEKHHVFLSGCVLPENQFVIRLCLLGHHLHFEQVQILIQDLKASLKELST